MKLPPTITEDAVLRAIDNAVRILAPSFAFGIYDIDDIRQEASMEVIKAMDKYDPTRPLDNFVYVHVLNRLINLRRNKLRRNDPPCRTCHESVDSRRSGHPDGSWCKKYLEWKKRNDAKASSMCPMDLEKVPEETGAGGTTVEQEAEFNEMLQLIDARLPVELRSTYLMIRAGKAVPKVRREEVEEAVREILGE